MNITAHVLAWNEELMLPYTLRHYSTFCNTIIVHDLGSTDRTREISEQAKAIVMAHDSKGQFDDSLNRFIKNSCWKFPASDWVMVLDCDEFIYFPNGVERTLLCYSLQGVPVVRPVGYEMLSDKLPTTDGQIYDELKHGAKHPDYCKPVLFTPAMVHETQFPEGAHTGRFVLHDGSVIEAPQSPTLPEVLLLHYHQIGPIERIAKKYDATTARMSQANLQNHWGNQKPGIIHAREKRDLILSGLEQVIP